MKSNNNILPTFTLKKCGWVDYKLTKEENNSLAINKLGEIEDFEKLVKQPILEYISELHAEHLELKKWNTALGTVKLDGKLHCPGCGVQVNALMNYCSACGQKLFIRKEFVNENKKRIR